MAIVDLELVFDFWSLLFCCIRWQRPSLQNAEYESIVNHSVQSAIQSLLSEETQRQQVAGKFEQLLPSVKPWIPSFQLLKALEAAQF